MLSNTMAWDKKSPVTQHTQSCYYWTRCVKLMVAVTQLCWNCGKCAAWLGNFPNPAALLPQFQHNCVTATTNLTWFRCRKHLPDCKPSVFLFGCGPKVFVIFFQQYIAMTKASFKKQFHLKAEIIVVPAVHIRRNNNDPVLHYITV